MSFWLFCVAPSVIADDTSRRCARYVLHEAEEQGLLLPWACRMGCCTACAVRVVSGHLHQPQARHPAAHMIDCIYGTSPPWKPQAWFQGVATVSFQGELRSRQMFGRDTRGLPDTLT